MAPIHFIIGVAVVLMLCWLIHRSNRKRIYSRRPGDLMRENYHLRHVIAEQAIDRHHPSDRR